MVSRPISDPYRHEDGQIALDDLLKGKGACTYDIRTGMGGVPQKQTTVLINCVSVTVTRGGCECGCYI